MEEGERFHERQDRIKENGNFFFRFTVSDRLPANSPFETVPIRRKKTSARTIFVFVLFCSADIRETILKNVSETKKKGESFLPFVFYFYLSILIGLLYLNVSKTKMMKRGRLGFVARLVRHFHDPLQILAGITYSFPFHTHRFTDEIGPTTTFPSRGIVEKSR